MKTWIIILCVLLAGFVSLRCYQQLKTDEAVAIAHSMRIEREAQQARARIERAVQHEVLVDHAIKRIRAGDIAPKESAELTADLLDASRGH